MLLEHFVFRSDLQWMVTQIHNGCSKQQVVYAKTNCTLKKINTELSDHLLMIAHKVELLGRCSILEYRSAAIY